MKNKPTISTVEQLRKLDPAPCDEALEWLADNNITDLADAWDRCHRGDWMLWISNALDLLSDRKRRLIACKCVRETPLIDGRKVWDLLTDERSRQAVVVAERYLAGDATDEELAAAEDAAASAATRADAARTVAAAVAAAAVDAAYEAAAARATRAAAAYAAAAAAAYAAAADVAAAAVADAVAAADAAGAYAADAAGAYATDAYGTHTVRSAAVDAARATQADIVRAIASNPFRDSATA
jgi:hypothetical protein